MNNYITNVYIPRNTAYNKHMEMHNKIEIHIHTYIELHRNTQKVHGHKQEIQIFCHAQF